MGEERWRGSESEIEGQTQTRGDTGIFGGREEHQGNGPNRAGKDRTDYALNG